MPEVLMPRLSDATAEATIVAWLVPDGAVVRIGDEVVEIETDKATTAWPADADGVLSIAVPAGRTVCPGTAIARIGDAGSTADAGTTGAAADRATPPDPAPVESPAAAADGTPADDRAPTLRAPSRIERLVSERMVQSRTEIPEFTVAVDVDLSAALALRGDLKAVGAPGGGGRTPSLNDLFVKACALALVDHPRVRSAWTDEGVLEHERVDIGVAVATDDGGLVVPVVRDADRVGLAALAASTRELTGRARQGRITAAEMSGATFTISNLGAMGVSHFTAIIGPGQGAILAIGAAIDRYVPVGGAPVLRPICTMTLSCDHRVVYGAHAAAYLERLKAILEHPGALAF